MEACAQPNLCKFIIDFLRTNLPSRLVVMRLLEKRETVHVLEKQNTLGNQDMLTILYLHWHMTCFFNFFRRCLTLSLLVAFFLEKANCELLLNVSYQF